MRRVPLNEKSNRSRSRFFHALVVVGAGVSVSAAGTGCGRSQRSGTGGSAGAGFSDTGGTSGVETGDSGGRESAGGTGGDPGPSAQWNCEGLTNSCESGTSGPYAGIGNAWRITADCPVEANRPRRATDCGDAEEMLCHLAVDVDGKQKLVNCACEPVDDAGCTQCITLTGQPANALTCRDGIKVCPCAFTGILR